MTMNRRQFASVTAAAASVSLQAAPKPREYFVYVGGYTGPKNKGIQFWRFEPSTGKLTAGGLAAETQNPSFLAIHPNGRYVFAANEIPTFDGQRTGSVTAFSMDSATGRLTLLNAVASKGGGPCYVSLDASGKYVLVANYGGGSIAVLPVGADGRLGEASAFVQHTGSSVNQKRQREPHAHCIKSSEDGRFVLASDLGIDQLMVYKLSNGALTRNDPPSFKTKPGAGPRHFAFHPNGKWIYIINELDSTVTAGAWDAKKGSVSELQTVTTLPEGSFPTNSTAEIVVHPNGKLLFGSNRGHNSIAVFDIDGKGRLALREHVPTKGEIPRNFALDPTGEYLFAANQRSDNVQVFKLDKSGKITHTGNVLECGGPVCVRFAPAG